MREIKFRVWTGFTMEYRILAGTLGTFYAPELDPSDSACICKNNTIYPKECPIMQYTCLKDKDGNEIYEGDILNPGLREIRFGDFISLSEDGFTPYSQGNGFYSICHELHMRPMPFSFAHRQSDGCEIIGNIYENPELLDKGK